MVLSFIIRLECLIIIIEHLGYFVNPEYPLNSIAHGFYAPWALDVFALFNIKLLFEESKQLEKTLLLDNEPEERESACAKRNGRACHDG